MKLKPEHAMHRTETRSGNQAIGVVGASARAAIHSILRAGFRGWAVDLFADRDLTRLVPCAISPTESYPKTLPALIEQFPPGPILYTGGLENHPDIVAELAAKRLLLGNPPEVLNRVRNPFFIGSFHTPLINHPRLVPTGEAAPNESSWFESSWLRKPLKSSSGHGIRFARAREPASVDHYFQEYIEGLSMSAVFLSMGIESCSTQLLGITKQLIGQKWLHARPFAYCGNIGQILLPRIVQDSIKRYGLALAKAAGLRGLWGMDFILRGDAVYPLEVNPRYTAAVEILELGKTFTSIRSHRDSFLEPRIQLEKDEIPGHSSLTIGKAIYYAPHAIAFPLNGPWDEDLAGPFDPWRLPGYADIPEPHTIIESGGPVLTLFAGADSPAACYEALQLRSAELDRLFAETTS
jgi:predicted ATP-grasp superfamily ATP-dependent carboligase